MQINSIIVAYICASVVKNTKAPEKILNEDVSYKNYLFEKE